MAPLCVILFIICRKAFGRMCNDHVEDVIHVVFMCNHGTVTASTFLDHDLVFIPCTKWIELPRVPLPSHDRSHGADRSLCIQHVFLMEIRTTFLMLELHSKSHFTSPSPRP
ncbi:hypothetical protein EDD85DRAFT_581674 [Armillaria nabsnona]|nr:hypothetical protein EDD85DRAFT_581674 [Armillaria nabsnona]